MNWYIACTGGIGVCVLILQVFRWRALFANYHCFFKSGFEKVTYGTPRDEHCNCGSPQPLCKPCPASMACTKSQASKADEQCQKGCTALFHSHRTIRFDSWAVRQKSISLTHATIATIANQPVHTARGKRTLERNCVSSFHLRKKQIVINPMVEVVAYKTNIM